MKWIILIAMAYQAHAADVCDPRKFVGAYGVQLSGNTTISGALKPVALIGRLVFDGKSSVSGYVSVNYTGLLLGNPVNGAYESQTDCSLTWSLQDDSGALQHFAGTMTGDMVRVQFHQTDKGGAARGLMVKTPKECSAAALRKSYSYSISGSTTASGVLNVGDAGKTFQMDSDCIIKMHLDLPVGDAGAMVAMNLRGILLDDGKEILAIQTDPNTTVTAKFTARE